MHPSAVQRIIPVRKSVRTRDWPWNAPAIRDTSWLLTKRPAQVTRKRVIKSVILSTIFVCFTTKQDVDECFIGADNCDVLLQICINQPGSFACIDRKDSPNTGPRPGSSSFTSFFFFIYLLSIYRFNGTNILPL